MQVLVNGAFLIIALMLSVAPLAAEAGKISGTVNYCDQGGVLGMKISLSGRQASLYTADDGKFVFDNVPTGRYALFYAIDAKMVYVSKDVYVQAGSTTDLGIVDFCATASADAVERKVEEKASVKPDCPPQSQSPECVDNDKDGVVAAKDCNDNDENIRPGAPETCDGIDNNCDGRIDELGAVWVENGKGQCQNGTITVQSCNQGFADCDGNPSNGCEIDLMNDNFNCGACGNECSSLEICALGMC